MVAGATGHGRRPDHRNPHRRRHDIRAGERLQMLDVEPGAYRVWIASGSAWSHDHFATDQMFQELDAPLTFDIHGTAPQTVVIPVPGEGNGSLLRVRSPFPLNLRD